MPGYVGLDVGQQEATVCFLLGDGREPVPRWAVPNSLPRAETLGERLAALAREHGVEALRIGMEATALYWWHLACALKDAPALAPYRPQVYALNPKLVHDFRQHDGALPKTDRADAFVIAERLRFGRQLPPPFQLDVRYAPRQRLTRFRVHLAQTLAREKSYFLTFLFLRFSGFSQANPFHDPFGATSCSDRPSTYCIMVMRANRAGAVAGRPHAENRGAKVGLWKSGPSSSSMRRYRLPFGKAARATRGVSSGRE